MPFRTIVIRGTLHEMIGDELVEVWLKIGAGDWSLYDTVPVTDIPPTQDFTFDSLEEGVEHVVQLRVYRDGRYRAGYLGGDPEEWPEQSRIEFVPGATAAAPPTIVSAAWERTSGVSERVTVTITPHPDNLDKTLQLLRGGVVVAEVDGPHVGDVDLIDVDPPGETNQTYTARHSQFTLAGEESDPLIRWVGPDAPTGLVQVAEIDDYYAYHVDWVNVAGSIRVRDDWPVAGFINRALLGSGTTHHDQAVEKESEKLEGADEVLTNCSVEVRHEVTAFAVTDLSEWVSVDVSITEHDDETAH